jgi:sec-independent protein translocase protein TatA
MPFHMGPFEIALILVIALIVIGVDKFPEAIGALGKGMRAFKKAQSGEDEEEATAKNQTGSEDKEHTAENNQIGGEDNGEEAARSSQINDEDSSNRDEKDK